MRRHVRMLAALSMFALLAGCGDGSDDDGGEAVERFTGTVEEFYAVPADQRVVVERVRDLFAQLCDVGQVTEYLELEGATHDDEYLRAADQIEAWLTARLAGMSPTDSCRSS